MWKNKKKYNHFKKIIFLLTALVCLMQGKPQEVLASEYWPDGPQTDSPSVMLMELSTGTVLYEKNSTEVHYPASITKILTTLVALENADLNEVVTFSDRAINETMGSGIARDYGEQMTLEQCLYAVMLESANECAFAVAEHVGGGSMEAFVDMMNKKAEEIGCTNTHFANPHGLQNENHYTCARDMALIAQAAYANETFRIITGTKIYTIPPTNKHPNEDTVVRNHHDMLVPYHHTKYVYENCTGGKTGYTDAANNTLVTYAEEDGMTLVCVIMNTQSPSQFVDTRSLFDYGFGNFQLVNIADNETRYRDNETIETGALNHNKAFVDIDDKAAIVLPKTAEFTDAVMEVTQNDEVSDVVGTISYQYAGHAVGKADIIKADVAVEEFVFDETPEQAESETDTQTEPETVSTVQIKPGTIIFLVCLAVVIVLLIFAGKKFYDNYYLIRHQMQIRKMEKDQFRPDRKRRKRRRRRRR